MRELSYRAARAQIRDGDVILFASRGWLQSLIRWVTMSRYSHVGIAARWYGRLMVIEARFGGVVACPLSLRLAEAACDWFAVVPSAESRRPLAARWVTGQIGAGYSTWQLALAARGETRDRDPGRYICSELAAGALRKLGIRDLPAVPTPGDLARHPRIQFRGRLRA